MSALNIDSLAAGEGVVAWCSAVASLGSLLLIRWVVRQERADLPPVQDVPGALH